MASTIETLKAGLNSAVDWLGDNAYASNSWGKRLSGNFLSHSNHL